MSGKMTEELVRAIKTGLFLWYDFTENASVLYVGNEDDIDPDIFTERGLRITFYNPEKSREESFDYILCSSVVEGHAHPEELLICLKGLLKPEGHLLLGVNNRLGIRYLCGDRDPYTGQNFDGIEGYCNAYRQESSHFRGRCYSREEWDSMLEHTGFSRRQFFSVSSGLDNPTMIDAEGYVTNEDLSTRVFPVYWHPDSVFLEEERLYGTLLKNGLFSKMCNAFLIDCTENGTFSDILHVTSSMERGREKALFTVIRRNGKVEKRAAYEQGSNRLRQMLRHNEELGARGIAVVETEWQNGACVMPYMDYPVGQLYLKELLHCDKEQFLRQMDHFRDLIFQASEIEIPDRGDGEGAILKKAYFDMVPLNSFYVDGEFVFYDQEFSEEHYPANVMVWRMIASFYFGDSEVEKLLPMQELLERYHLNERLERWQSMEFGFLDELRKTVELAPYFSKKVRNMDTVRTNRLRMNESETYRFRTYLNIFDGIVGKKLFLFGTGKYAARFREQYGNDFPIYAMLDNNAEKVGTRADGIEIVSPKYLESLPQGSYKVMICVKDYQPIIEQLEGMGVKNYSVYDPNRYYQTRPRTSIRIVEGNGSDGTTGTGNSSETKLARSAARTVDLSGTESAGSVAKTGGPSGAEPGEQAAETPPRKKYAVGYVAGAFDMFHIGHVNLLRRAKEQCDYLIVGVMSDERMYELKHKYPVIPCNERMQVVAACRYADQVEELPVDRAGIRDAYHMFHFDCMFSGDDHSTDSGWLAEQAYLREHGSDIFFFPYTKETSSTEIRDRAAGGK